VAACKAAGYADAIDYRAQSDLVGAIAKTCPRGVDVFIDNTAGAIHEAVMQNLATHARVVLVGSISLAGKFGQPDIGPRFHRQTLIARATIQGFLVSDYSQEQQTEARLRMADWVRRGLLKSRFDIAKGIESTPQAFLRLLTSRNLGKQLVQVADEPAGRTGSD
jgi:NADPH-dependent curcumin reductase CurA